MQERIRSYSANVINSPWASPSVTQAVIRLTDRAQVAKNNMVRVKQVTKGINASLWPEEAFDDDLPTCPSQLEKVPVQVTEWKKFAGRSGTSFALALTKMHCSKIKEEDLQLVGGGNPSRKDCSVYLLAFMETASKIASVIELDTFVMSTGVPETPEDEPKEEKKR